MKSKFGKLVRRLAILHRKMLAWRTKNINNQQFIYALSILVGLAAGTAALVLKTVVHYIQRLLQHGAENNNHYYLYLAFPIIGILLTRFVIKYVIRKPVRDGLPNVLHAISQKDGKIGRHNMYSSIITSAITVGFGGSVGLEGPTVTTGSAIGSNLGRWFKLGYKETVLMLACACAAAIAAIFKAPIAAIVFAIEIIMLDLTMTSLVPLLLASSTGALLSYFVLGHEFTFSFQLVEAFKVNQLPYFLGLGVISGFMSIYFTRVYMFTVDFFEERIKKSHWRLLIGGLTLGVLIFFMPSLYGEGYEAIIATLKSDHSFLFNESIFYPYRENFTAVVLILLAVILLKVVASATTLGIGGVGGFFAPSLFVGATTGLLYGLILNHLGVSVSVSNFALVGMAGLLAGVLHAPLTGLFLIAEITGGYGLFMPLMIVSTISYATIRYFHSNSLYTFQLAKRRQLLTHNKDTSVLRLMKVEKLIENNFIKVHANDTLGDLVQAIAQSPRNIFPVVDEDDRLVGIVRLDDIRHIMFKQEKYNKPLHKLMVAPDTYVTPEDSMEDVAKKIQITGRFNIPVLENGKYVGFVSRANVFSAYRSMLKDMSEY